MEVIACESGFILASINVIVMLMMTMSSLPSRGRCVRVRAIRIRSRWVGVGLDRKGRLLEYIAVEDEPDGWLVFHAMLVTRAVLAEVGLRR